MISQQELEQTFYVLERAALAGERAPQSYPFGEVKAATVLALARAGRIKSEVYAQNWRVITIMEGPNRGKHTKMPSVPGAPYKIVYKDHVVRSRFT